MKKHGPFGFEWLTWRSYLILRSILADRSSSHDQNWFFTDGNGNFNVVDDGVDEDDDDIDDDDDDVTHCANQHICSWFFDSLWCYLPRSKGWPANYWDMVYHGLQKLQLLRHGGGVVCLFQSSSLTLKICCSTWVAGVGGVLGVGYLWWVDHCIQP